MDRLANKPVKHGQDHLPGGQDPVPFPPAPASPWYGLDFISWTIPVATALTPDVGPGQFYMWHGGIPGPSGGGWQGAADQAVLPVGTWDTAATVTATGQQIVGFKEVGAYLIASELQFSTTGAMASPVYQTATLVSTADGVTWVKPSTVGSPTNLLLELSRSDQTPAGAVAGDYRTNLWVAIITGFPVGAAPSVGVVIDLFADPTTYNGCSGNFFFTRLFARSPFSLA